MYLAMKQTWVKAEKSPTTIPPKPTTMLSKPHNGCNSQDAEEVSEMIEEKLKIAAEKLPVPQTTFESIAEKAAQKPKDKCTQTRCTGL